MIYINRLDCPPILDLTDNQSKAFREREDAIHYYSTHQKGFEFKVYQGKSIKSKLTEMFHGKCAYCESEITSITYGDIEHFRPKSAYKNNIEGDYVYPGYYWLASDWINLLLACERCNRTHKGSIFPLASGTNRKTRHDINIDEQPLLIDPTIIDPKEFISFTDTGLIIFLDGEGNRGDSSIKIYGLARTKLTIEREKVALRLKETMNGIITSCRTISELIKCQCSIDIIFENISRLGDLYSFLEKSRLETSEYAGMARAITEDFLLENKTIIEKLLNLLHINDYSTSTFI